MLTKALVVDDNFYHVFAIKEMIKQLKIEVDTASDGSEAID